MTNPALNLELSFDKGVERCCASYRRERTPSPPTLQQFIWRPPEDWVLTQIRREIQRLRQALRQVTDSPKGQTFDQLMSDPTYAQAYEHGYGCGRTDGSDFTRAQWKREYAEVLSLLVQGLGACVQDPLILPAITAALTYEYILVPSHTEVRDPKFREVLRCLRTGMAGEHYATTQDREEAHAPEDLEILEAAQWTYFMGLVPNEISLLDLIAMADIAVADWVADLREELTELLARLVELNGDPCQQGYFVGWYVGATVVETVRSILENAVELAGPL